MVWSVSSSVVEIQFYSKMGDFTKYIFKQTQQKDQLPCGSSYSYIQEGAVVPNSSARSSSKVRRPVFPNTCTKGNTTMLVTRSKVDLL